MALNALMDGALAALPDGLAVCYIDMPEALVLTRRTRRAFSQEVLDALATISAHLLDGAGVAATWRQATGRAEADRPDEVLVQNGEHSCLLLRVQKYPDHALCVLARRNGDVAQMRLVATQLCKDIADAI